MKNLKQIFKLGQEKRKRDPSQELPSITPSDVATTSQIQQPFMNSPITGKRQLSIHKRKFFSELARRERILIGYKRNKRNKRKKQERKKESLTYAQEKG